MKIIRNSIIPFKGFAAINIFGVLFARKDSHLNVYTLNHESIHTAQIKELGYILFYLIYFVEWLVRLTQKGNAYRNISFEREAYSHEYDLKYLSNRHRYAQWRKSR